MPLSTSSSDRMVPEQPWGRVAACMAVLVILALGGWEAAVRGMGYGPSYNDTALLWGMSRDDLKSHKNDTNVVAIVGASRIRFDLDHEAVSETFGGVPVVNLSMNGSVARPVLHDLATDETFCGTVICGYVPNLFWAPGGPNLEETEKWLREYAHRTPSSRAGQWIALAPESVFAFLQKEDLSLGPLAHRLVQLPNREGVMMPPELPPYFARVDRTRREHMWEKMETDPDFQQRVQNIWKGLFSMARPLPPPLLEKLRGEVVADVEAIRARGGDVILVRFPSTGWVREFENETAPRDTHWDPLIAASGCMGIHFEDYPELRDYQCPEWSHLTRADAETFSRDLMRIIGEKR